MRMARASDRNVLSVYRRLAPMSREKLGFPSSIREGEWMAHLIAAAIAFTLSLCSTPDRAAAQFTGFADAIGLGVGTTTTVTPTGVPAGTTATPTPTPTAIPPTPQLPTATVTFSALIDQGGCAIAESSPTASVWWLGLLPAAGVVRIWLRAERPQRRRRRRPRAVPGESRGVCGIAAGFASNRSRGGG